jgi:hypothetical protein
MVVPTAARSSRADSAPMKRQQRLSKDVVTSAGVAMRLHVDMAAKEAAMASGAGAWQVKLSS